MKGQASEVRGLVVDPQGGIVAGSDVEVMAGSRRVASGRSDGSGKFAIAGVPPGSYRIKATSRTFLEASQAIEVGPGFSEGIELKFTQIAPNRESIVITAQTVEPEIDMRNAEVFNRTLFSRDDQIFQQLNAGINAGQHEGGGKSLEIRRFGFNLDHGGVNGGLKVMLDNVQQNQGTQGHGQGYLGAMKSISPELIQQVTIVNGPFSAEYGDFSGLGVVHIRQRETLPDEYTVRLQGGSYNTGRGFLGWSPAPAKTDAYLAYEGSYSDGPFVDPLHYRRDNINGNYTRSFGENQKAGVRFVFGRNDFFSSGQIPLDLVDGGQLDRFGYLDPTNGGRIKLGTVSAYYSKALAGGDTFKVDGFVGRSLFDLFSNFTFFLNDPVNGDAIQQHDSRLQQGSNVQWVHYHRVGRGAGSFTSGGNFHDNQINVGLYPRQGRMPTGVTTRANAHVTNGAGYGQENLTFFQGRLALGLGLRWDGFRYDVTDRVDPILSGTESAARWQGKGHVAYTPSARIPVTVHANYGRGINSVDARIVVQKPDLPRLAATDFYQFGISSNLRRLSASADVFLIDHSHEQVYIPDDGTFEFKGPSRAYGYEAKASFEVTHHIALNGGLTKISNAFFRGGETRVYVDSAPHFVANAGLTVSGWRGWSGSLRMRAINHYRLDGEDPSIRAAGHTVFDLSVAKRITHALELNFSLDNLTSRDYWETQNYFESRVSPMAEAVSRIHATPAYPITAMAGVTLRFGGK